MNYILKIISDENVMPPVKIRENQCLPQKLTTFQFSQFYLCPDQIDYVEIFFWLAAWGQSYKGKTGQLNNFNVITYSQQQHYSYLHSKGPSLFD